jgi:DNA replication protein DnaC
VEDLELSEMLALSKRLSSVVPSPRHIEARFENYKPTTKTQAAALEAAKDFVSNWLSGELGGLWLLGPIGTGKTHLAVAIIHASIKDDIKFGSDCSYAFADWHDIVDEFRQWPKRDQHSAERLVNADLLVIDDMQAADERTACGFEWMVDRRYRAKRPTILTSNLDQQSIREVVGHRAFDRLREGAVMRVLQGASYRARFGWDGPNLDEDADEPASKGGGSVGNESAPGPPRRG